MEPLHLPRLRESHEGAGRAHVLLAPPSLASLEARETRGSEEGQEGPEGES